MEKKSLTQFKASFSNEAPPPGLSEYAKALWWAGKGDWNRAHEIVQEMEDRPSARIHAFLHRQEGDISNAGYWYHRAGTAMPSMSLDKEWEDLVLQFLTPDP